jgi:hypothetical protein
MESQDSRKAQPPTPDFAHWRSDHESWERDVSRWQADHQLALTQMAQIEKLILNHRAAVRRHATAIQAHQGLLSTLRPSSSGSTEDIDALTKAHRLSREAHDRIRLHHDNAMALLRALVDALGAPM